MIETLLSYNNALIKIIKHFLGKNFDIVEYHMLELINYTFKNIKKTRKYEYNQTMKNI